MKLILLISSILFVAGSQMLSAQTHYGPDLNKILSPMSSKGWLYFSKDAEVLPDAFFSRYGGDMLLGPQDEMRLVKKETDDIGFTHYFFQQYHAEIRVRDGAFFVHEDASGNLHSANGVIVENLSLPVTPTLSAVQAIESAKKKMGAKQYMWENEFWEKDLRQHPGKENASSYPSPELVIYSPKTSTSAQLVYTLDLFSADPFAEKQYLVDAKTGAIVAELPLASDCNPSTLNTIFDGNRSISTDKFASGPDNYRTRDDCQAGIINIRDWNSATLTAAAVDVTSANNTWTNTNQRFAGSVLWGIEQASSFYQTTFSRNSYNNGGGDVDGFINAQFDDGNGNPYSDNASMSFTSGRLKVGLGSSGTLANCWGPLDVLGHEYTHAVTGSEAGLDYSGESGALNESFSDIFGEMVENFVNGNCDYLVGNDRSSGAIRTMNNPNTAGDPDTYLGSSWLPISGTCDATNDNCGVHRNSGVQNFWFFLLAEGGNGINDNGDNYTVTGIGKTDATRIAYKNLTDILTSTSDYAAARAGSILAANMIFGNCSFQTQQVINAWNAVGVYNTTGFDCGCSTNVVRTGAEVSNLYESSTWIRSTAVVTPGDIVTYDADKFVALKPGFHAQKGSYFHALIDGCFGLAPRPASNAVMRSENQQIAQTIAEKNAEKAGMLVYPNPFQSQLNVQFEVAQNGLVTLQLTDALGRLVAEPMVQQMLESGQYTLPLEMGQLPFGLYYVALSTPEGRWVRKVVKGE